MSAARLARILALTATAAAWSAGIVPSPMRRPRRHHRRPPPALLPWLGRNVGRDDVPPPAAVTAAPTPTPRPTFTRRPTATSAPTARPTKVITPPPPPLTAPIVSGEGRDGRGNPCPDPALREVSDVR